MLPSTLFLDSNFLHGESGDGIVFADAGVIGTSQVGENISNPMLTLSDYDRLSSNILLNPSFNSGDLTSWNSVGSPTVQLGDYPGLMYELLIDNLENVSQQVSGFSGKHPVFEFWHKGQQIIFSLELRDGSNVYLDGLNRIIPNNDKWTRFSIGMYNYFPTAVSAKVTLASVWDGSIIANCSLVASDFYSAVNIGDEFDADSTDVVRVYGKKLMVGSGLAGINDSILDVRGNQSISGDLFVNGTVYSNIIFGPPGTLRFSTNLIFSSGSSSLLNWSSGLVETIDTTSYGINSGSATISGLTYIYLDLTISSSILQTSTTYSDVIGNQKIFLGTAQNQSVGNVSFTSQSGQTPIISGQQLTPSSVTFDKVSINSLSAITANMGALSVDSTLTLTTGAIILGTATSPTTGSGIYEDSTGIYSVLSGVTQTSLTSSGLAAGNYVNLNSLGLSLLSVSSYNNGASIKFYDGASPTSLLFKGIYSDYYVVGPTRHIRLNIINDTSPSSANEISITASNATLGSNLITLTADLVYLNSSVSVGTSSPNANAIMDLVSTTMAFMPPRMSTTQRNAIASPTAGMVIYNNTTNKLNVYTTTWEAITSV